MAGGPVVAGVAGVVVLVGPVVVDADEVASVDAVVGRAASDAGSSAAQLTATTSATTTIASGAASQATDVRAPDRDRVGSVSDLNTDGCW